MSLFTGLPVHVASSVIQVLGKLVEALSKEGGGRLALLCVVGRGLLVVCDGSL